MENERLDFSHILPFFEPDERGIVGVSEEISIQRLYSAYMQGIFPWFCEDEGECVVWHCPNPRFCIKMEDLRIPRSAMRDVKKARFSYTMDEDFFSVIDGCRKMSRKGQSGTWIGQKMIRAYTRFYELGLAHSVEVWSGKNLAGGFYGVLIGSVFFGESMFTIESGSSKSAFALFAEAFKNCGGKLIDSQVYTQNIARFGAAEILRDEFLFLEKPCLDLPLSSDLKSEFLKISSRAFE